MTHDSREEIPARANAAAARHNDELFCIHSYAGEAGPPCGWRGRFAEVRREKETPLRCPRCGRATLLEIPRAE